MNESLLQLKTDKFDGINFYINEDGDTEVDVFLYKEPSEKVEGSSMGDLYDIIIFQEEPPKMPERFKAILISPAHYVSRMIEDGFLGVVAKVTKASDSFMDHTEKHMNEMVTEYIKTYEENYGQD
jgi:hypothetical protein